MISKAKNYENVRKNIFGLSVVLEFKVKNSKILTIGGGIPSALHFPVIFSFDP